MSLDPAVTPVTDGLLALAEKLIRPLDWMDDAACQGLADLFFGPDRERPEARRRREEKVRLICQECPVLLPCRTHARQHREPGFWGGESEQDREGAR